MQRKWPRWIWQFVLIMVGGVVLAACGLLGIEPEQPSPVAETPPTATTEMPTEAPTQEQPIGNSSEAPVSTEEPEEESSDALVAEDTDEEESAAAVETEGFDPAAPRTGPIDVTQPCNGRNVRLARATWDTGWFQAEVVKQLLEEFGCTVEPITKMSNEDFYRAAAEGHVDLWANAWLPLHNIYREDDPDIEANTTAVGSLVRAGALQGYMIDRTTADNYAQLTTLRDLQDPTLAALFDTDGNGKANLIGCQSDWGCADVIEHHLDEYNLRNTVEHVQGNYDQLMNNVLERYRNDESVLFYTWTPNWTIGEMSRGTGVVWLEVPYPSLPSGDLNEEDRTQVEGFVADGCINRKDPCVIGFPPNDILIMTNRQFLEHPPTKRLLEPITIPLDDIAAQNIRMRNRVNTADNVAEDARAWIDSNREQVDTWIEGAAELVQVPGQGESTLQRVIARGKLICGVHGDLQGFSAEDSNGRIIGFDADFCRVVAAAVLGDPEAVEFRNVGIHERFRVVADREVDVLFRNTTWTARRDLGMNSPNAGIRVAFGPTIFHDGQSLMVRRTSGITSLSDLAGLSICVQKETTAETNLRDQLNAKNVEAQIRIFDQIDSTYAQYDQGTCDAVTSDASQLAGRRLELVNPDAHQVLDLRISREPLGPVYAEDDSEWGDVINWSVYTTMYAEELRVTSENVDDLYAAVTDTRNEIDASIDAATPVLGTNPLAADASETELVITPEIERLLGVRGDIGTRMGLDNDFAYRIISGVGNYGEIYEQHLGLETPVGLERGPNKVWNLGQGGVLSSPPFR